MQARLLLWVSKASQVFFLEWESLLTGAINTTSCSSLVFGCHSRRAVLQTRSHVWVHEAYLRGVCPMSCSTASSFVVIRPVVCRKPQCKLLCCIAFCVQKVGEGSLRAKFFSESRLVLFAMPRSIVVVLMVSSLVSVLGQEGSGGTR